MKDKAIDQLNDFHEACFHCTDTKGPIWPVTDLEAWKLEVCQVTAQTEETEKQFAQHALDKIESQKARAAKKAESEKKRRDQVVRHMSTMRERRLGLLQINYGGNTIMAKKNKTVDAAALTLPPKKLTKTGLIDSLIGADLAGSYAEGAVENITGQVLATFPDLDAKRVKGLIFSRRAVLKAQAVKAQQAASEPAPEAEVAA